MERSELPLPASLPYSYCHTGLVNLLACLLSKPAHRLFTLRLRLPIRGMTGITNNSYYWVCLLQTIHYHFLEKGI